MKTSLKFIIFVFAFFVSIFAFAFYLLKPTKVKSANFTNVTASLSNSRFSFYAGYSAGSIGQSRITIDTSGNPDKDVDNLFVGDYICIAPSNFVGCRDNTTYGVVTTEGTNGDEFTISPALISTPDANDLIIATSSGILTVQFTLTNNVPDGGDILITIPSDDDTTSTTSTDGFPDAAATTSVGGFDLNGITSTHVSTSTSSSGSCNNSHWSATETITPGNGTTDHTIRIDRSGSECQANNTVITVTIGTTSKGIVVPPPTTNARTQGVADIYSINIKTRDNTDNTIDQSNALVAPVEGVFVSATVRETLSFQVAGDTSGASRCGQTTDVTTTATSVPWGEISTTGTFFEASQILTVSTNAVSGYKVYIEENDQMGKDGNTCTGTVPSSGQFTFGSGICIRDTVCNATTCSESVGYNWTNASTYPGLGISLQNLSGTDAAWVYNSNDPCSTTAGTGSFCAKQIADTTEGGETRSYVMTNSGPVDSSQVYLCFRLSIPGTQPAGFYYNIVKYTAVPTF